MAMPFAHEDLEKLKKFVDFVSANPTILNFPQLKFVKDFVEKLGGSVPSGEFKMPSGGGCPFSGAAKTESKAEAAMGIESEEEEMETEPESEVELDLEGVIEGDENPNQFMGEAEKIPSDEDIDEAGNYRTQAAAAYSEQKFEEAVNLYTKAIKLNPVNALFFAKRGQAFLKLQKPNACIRDCNKALELNCDSAAAYKFRGRAHRLLGNWESAANDLRQACKIDFDEEADDWLREVTPNAKKIEQHRIKQERIQAEQKMRRAQAATRKARKPQEAEQKKQNANSGARTGPKGFAGAGAGGFNMSDLLSGVQDPEIAAALQDIATNPANIDKYKSNPKIAALIDVVKSMAGGGGGFPGFAGFGGASPKPPTEEAKTDTTTEKSKKPDFVDDGLD